MTTQQKNTTASIHADKHSELPAKPAHTEGETLQDCLDQGKGGPHVKADAHATGAHTPGPWTIIGAEIRSQANSESVALIVSDSTSDKANARLIAAAPETAAERDRLNRELDETISDYGRAVIERDQAREQVQTLLAACKAALNDVNTANRLVFETLGATRSQAPIEATLSVTARELRAAIAAVESEGQ